MRDKGLKLSEALFDSFSCLAFSVSGVSAEIKVLDLLLAGGNQKHVINWSIVGKMTRRNLK